MATSERRQFLISKVWMQAAVLLFLFGFFVLGLLAYRTYQAGPPVPARVVDARGALTRNAVTFVFCQTARSSRSTTAIFVSNCTA